MILAALFFAGYDPYLAQKLFMQCEPHILHIVLLERGGHLTDWMTPTKTNTKIGESIQEESVISVSHKMYFFLNFDISLFNLLDN